MSIEREAIDALKWTAAARLIGQLVSWVSTLFVLRLLDPADYGLMAIIVALLGILGAVAEFGLGPAMVQARELERAKLAQLAGLVLVLHVAVAALMVGFAPLLGWFFRDVRLSLLFQVASLQFVFAALASVPHAVAVRAMNFARLARIEVVTMVLGSLGSLAMAFVGMGVWALVGGMLIASGGRSLMLLAGGGSVWPSFRFRGLGTQLSYSGKMASSHVLWMVVSQSDVMVGGRLLASDALGLYSVALNLATLPMNKIMGTVNQVAFAAVARLQEEPERLRKRVLQGNRLAAALSVGTMWGMAATAPELVHVVIGSKWEASIVPLQLIGIVVPLRTLAMLLSTAVGAVGKAGVSLHNTFTAAIVWPLCFVMGAQWGVVGLAAAWLAAAPLTFAWNAPRICAALGLRTVELLRPVFAPAVAGVVMVGAISAARLFTSGRLGDAVLLGLLIVVGACAYVAALLALDRAIWTDFRKLLATQRG